MSTRKQFNAFARVSSNMAASDAANANEDPPRPAKNYNWSIAALTRVGLPESVRIYHGWAYYTCARITLRLASRDVFWIDNVGVPTWHVVRSIPMANIHLISGVVLP
jgi:hypothetical protein